MLSFSVNSLVVLVCTLSYTNTLLWVNNRAFHKHSTRIQNSIYVDKRYDIQESTLARTFLAATPSLGEIVVAEVDDIVSSFEDPFISLKV